MAKDIMNISPVETSVRFGWKRRCLELGGGGRELAGEGDQHGVNDSSTPDKQAKRASTHK